MKECIVVDLGVIDYAKAVELQARVVSARKADELPDVLLLCEHPPVITLGRNGKRENLRASEHVLRQMGVALHSTSRGGDITYHGPGQLVGYPILHLASIRRDVVWYVRQLEEVMIRATADFGTQARREAGLTGVWVQQADGKIEKLGALGVHISRWVTSHGFAYNVATDLRYFDLIVPCGIPDKRATSLERVLGRAVRIVDAMPNIVRRFGEVFGFEMRAASQDELEHALAMYELRGTVEPAGASRGDCQTVGTA